MRALARVSRAEAHTHTVTWTGTCETCERHGDIDRHRTQTRTSFIELTTTETRASEALHRNAICRHPIRRCPHGDTGTTADWAAISHGPPVLAFHVPHTTTVATTLEPDLDYLGHRYVLRALILAQQGHFVTISRRWCGRPRGPVWLYQDSIHKPEPVLTAIARRQDQGGVTRTETDPTTEDFCTLCHLVAGAFRGLLYTLEVPMPPSPHPDATEDSPTHQHVAESSTPDDPGPTADHHHLGPAARATAGPNPATTLRKRPPSDDMSGRPGKKRGKTIPGVDVLNATWLTNPPQAVLDAPRTTGTTEAVAATTAAADCPGDMAPTVPLPQQSQQPEEDHEAEPAQPPQQQPQQQQQQHE